MTDKQFRIIMIWSFILIALTLCFGFVVVSFKGAEAITTCQRLGYGTGSWNGKYGYYCYNRIDINDLMEKNKNGTD